MIMLGFFSFLGVHDNHEFKKCVCVILLCFDGLTLNSTETEKSVGGILSNFYYYYYYYDHYCNWGEEEREFSLFTLSLDQTKKHLNIFDFEL